MFKIAIEIDIDELIKKALDLKDERGRDVVIRRFGLDQPERLTLASLGDEYGLTRERVRQIEASTLEVIKEAIEQEKQAQLFRDLIDKYLENVSKLRRSDLLARDIALICKIHDDHDLIFENKLNFLAKVLKYPYVEDETQGLHAIWHKDADIHKLALKLVDKLLRLDKHDFDHYIDKIKREHNLLEAVIVNYLSVSKNFSSGPYGHIGADHWVHINPKTVRDKAYLVLKHHNRPMHFSEIARLINEIGEKERAHATVHNELIRDSRFVLTGRGTYSLNE